MLKDIGNVTSEEKYEQSLGRGKRVCEGSGLVGSNPKVHKENRQTRFEFQIVGIIATLWRA